MSIRARLVIMCIVVSLLPAVPLSVLVETLIEKSFHLGLSPTVEEALQSGLTVSRTHLGTLHTDFENAVDELVMELSDDHADSTVVSRKLAAEGLHRGGVDGFLVAGAAWPKTLGGLPESLAGFAGNPVLARLIDGKDVLARTGDTGIRFFYTEDRSLQLALWSPGPAAALAERGTARSGGEGPDRAVLFYKRTDPEFMAQAQRILEGRQIFAQLRLEQPTLSRSFFYPFMLIYGVILLLSLAFALLMAERLSNPIRRLAQGANIVAQGDWAYRLRGSAGGEIGHLVSAFNDMVSRLDTQRRRLIDMEKMASWREVARHLAHEIKNPLLPIRLTVEELRDQYKGGDASYRQLVDESVRVVGEEVDHLQTLVKEFSAFARMPELKPRPGSLETIVADVARLYAQIPVRIDADSGAGDSRFDPDQMRRVMVNLMDNAASALKDTGHPEIVIRLNRVAGDVVLSIADNGPGIEPGAVGRVFEPYFTTKPEGSGLGLAMVKNIVLLHGGSIDIQSRPGEGTTFEIALPVGGPGPGTGGRDDTHAQSRS